MQISHASHAETPLPRRSKRSHIAVVDGMYRSTRRSHPICRKTRDMTFITEATSAPANVIANLITDAGRGISTLTSLVRRYRDYSKAEAQLMTLTDRELNDLGVVRSDIRARVWANFDQR